MNLPNKLTLMRVLMVPAFVAAFLFSGVSPWIPLVLFVAAGITDILDGEIARRQNIVTDFGKLMDPLADKIMVTAVLICFSSVGYVHPAVTILIISRELFVTGFRTLATIKGKVIAADFWGKLKTVFQDITIILILLWRTLDGVLAEYVWTISYWFIWIMAALTVISGVNYCVKNRSIFVNEK